jgi:predicted esterase
MAELDNFQAVRQELVRLYNEKKFAEGVEMLEREAGAYPDQLARTTFWRICLLSLGQRPNDALNILEDGLNQGLWWHKSQFMDSDLNAIRELPRFKALVERSQVQFDAVREQAKPEREILVPECAGPYPLLVALHGHGGDKSANLEHWEAARKAGWLVFSAQSGQPLFPGAYCWDDPASGLQDIRFHFDEVFRGYPIDRERILIGGFSQGSGMAITAALQPEFQAKGFIGVGTWWPDVESIAKAAAYKTSIRGYFITGLRDQTLERAREIQAVLKENGIPFEEEVWPDLGHEFPPDFGNSFEKAIKFIWS